MSDPRSAVRDWDAVSYDRLSDAQHEWGLEVLDRLALRGDERALDAGCGSGRVTAALVERLPHGRVVAVDASASMVERTRERLGDRVDARVADLVELRLEEAVDVILSTAVLHWVPDHRRLFERLRGALAPGGRLEAQCGGEGNIAGVRAAIAEVSARASYADSLGGWPGPWNFAAPAPTEALLREAGFVEAHAWLERKILRTEEPEAFLRTVTLGSHLERLGPELREAFVRHVAEPLGRPLAVDYVRLNISARRGD